MQNVDIGTMGEVGFVYKALRNKLKVSKPIGIYPYDFIVDNEKGLYRIQVKTCTSYNKQTYSYTLSTKRKQSKNESFNYSEKDIDFIAAYVLPLDTWYIIPIKELTDIKGIALFPHNRASTSKWEKYRERWDILND